MQRIPIDELANAEREVGGHIELIQDIAGQTPLANADIVPTRSAQRTWNWWHICALWIGMAVCIPSYNLAAGLIASGMDWKQAFFTIVLGNVIVLVPMILNAAPGTKYGIPFPVLARASFGTLGSNVPAILRALVACGWFGIQTWIGGAALYAMCQVLWPGIKELGELPAFLGKGSNPLLVGELICFLLFWAWNVFHILRGMESIKWLESLAAPFLIVIGVAFMFWAKAQAGGWGEMLAKPATADFSALFLPSLTAMVGFWATLSLNIPDFSRFAKSQKDQIVGQTLGLPGTMALYAFIGIAVTSATALIFGETIWDPTTLITKMHDRGMAGGAVIVVAGFAMALATISTNIAANVVSPANDFANIAPRLISFKTGGMITAVLGIVMMPWKLVADPSGYIFTWLIGYGTLLGPIAGIMIADYYVIRKGKLNLLDLYRTTGEYSYTGGFNFVAIGSLVVAVLPAVPGFLMTVIPATFDGVFPVFFKKIYEIGWFGCFVSGFVVYSLWMSFAAPKTGHGVQPA
jgi:NCS1 family nucleobase:cation symporter-1